MLRKIGAAAAAVLLTTGVGLVASAPADAAHAGFEARSVLPYHGYYEGHDGHNRVVTFYYDGHSISNNTVRGQRIVTSAPVSGATVHHRCDSHTHKCVRGHWASDIAFYGTWNDPNQGHESHFIAYVLHH